MNNAYPEKPIVPYRSTTIAMSAVIAYLAGLAVSEAIKRSAYTVFRIESGNGLHGVNNNYGGFQADGSRWPEAFDDQIVGVVAEHENGTQRERLFIAFDTWQASVAMLVDRFEARGIYVNPSAATSYDLAQVYYRQWVTGNPTAVMPAQQVETFQSIYAQATGLFPVASDVPPVHTEPASPSEPTADDLNADVLEGKPLPPAREA